MSNELAQLDTELTNQQQQIAPLLPANVDFDRFKTVTLNALQNQPDLMSCDRDTLFKAIRECAADGLMPDGKEAVITKFKSREGPPTASYLPMVQGIYKIANESDEIAMFKGDVVHEGDKFRHWTDDTGDHLVHERALTGDPGKLILAYAMAVTHSGQRYIEVLRLEDIERIRKCSRSPDKGPWLHWYDRMAIKSAIHRLGDRLPRGSQRLQRAISRDHAMYDFERGDQTRVEHQPTASSTDALRSLSQQPEAPGEPEQPPQQASKTVTLFDANGQPVQEYAKAGSYLNAVERALKEAGTQAAAQAVWQANAETLDRFAETEKYAERVRELAQTPATLPAADDQEGPGW